MLTAKRLYRITQLLCGLIFSLYMSSALSLERYELKAALVYNFSKQITWPDESNKTLTIAVMGQQDALYGILKKGLKEKSVRGMPLQIIQIDSVESLVAPAIIVTDPVKNSDNKNLLRRLKGKKILIIDESQEEKGTVMINIFNGPDDTLKFEINRPNILSESLKIGPDILLLGGTELDVVDLFKETEKRLKNSEIEAANLYKKLELANKKLDEINSQIKQGEQQLSEKFEHLSSTEKAYQEKTSELQMREDELMELNKRVEELKTESLVSAKTAENALREAKEANTKRTNSEAELLKLNNDISSSKELLELLKTQLSQAEAITSIQKIKIQQQQTLISTVIVALCIVGTLLALLFRSRRSLVKSRTELEKSNEELRIARASADQASLAKSQFLATMSHEIRTPMNAIIGMSEILRESQLSPSAAEHNEIIRSAAIGLLSILNDILDFSKIEAGKMDIVNENFNLIKLIKEIRRIFEKIAHEKGIELKLELDQKIPNWVFGDEQRLRQMLINLVNNALKFTEHGNITIKAICEGDLISISIIDTGCGLSQESLSKLFQQFVQVGETKNRPEGTGLGLAICKKLSLLMGGDIFASSEVGKGSTFTLKLPLPERHPEKNSQSVNSNQAYNQDLPLDLSIWIAEDNTVNQKVIDGMLKKLGFETRIFNNGQELLDAYKLNQSADIIFMDCEMPILNGWDATVLIREYEKIEKIKPTYITALTAHALDEFNEQAKSSGMNAVLHKPLTMKALKNGILQASTAHKKATLES